MPEDDVIRVMHSLSCGRYKVIAKDPPGKLVNKNDTFSMNHNFTDRLRRIKVSACVCAQSLLGFLWDSQGSRVVQQEAASTIPSSSPSPRKHAPRLRTKSFTNLSMVCNMCSIINERNCSESTH